MYHFDEFFFLLMNKLLNWDLKYPNFLFWLVIYMCGTKSFNSLLLSIYEVSGIPIASIYINNPDKAN